MALPKTEAVNERIPARLFVTDRFSSRRVISYSSLEYMFLEDTEEIEVSGFMTPLYIAGV